MALFDVINNCMELCVNGTIHQIVMINTDDRAIHGLLAYPESERENVMVVSIDLSPFFHKLAEECFPNAEIAADKFHAVRLANNALDSIRKEVQAGLLSRDKKWFRNARHILLGRESKLSLNERCKLAKMLSFSETLRTAHALKEEYYRIFDSADRKMFKERLHDFQRLRAKFSSSTAVLLERPAESSLTVCVTATHLMVWVL